jgi:adhesin HecA-like repeat protein
MNSTSRTRVVSFALALTVAVAASALLAVGAGATTILVRNTHDKGPGSLRDAVTDAPDGATIQVPAGAYRLTSGAIDVSVSLNIDGANARQTVITGSGKSQIFTDSVVGTKLSLIDVTLKNANSHGSDGGAVSTNGAVTLNRAAVVDNTGGPMSSNPGGGGLYVNGKFVMRSSLLAGNTARTGGGAYVGGPIVLSDSTIADNTAGDPDHNGVSGAIESDDQPSTVISSTIAFNRCFNGAGCGGAFYNGDFTFRDSIISRNEDFDANGQPAGSMGNPGVFGGCSGPDPVRYQSAGHNIGSGVNDCNLVKPTDHNTNPQLRGLENNGGPTDTLALGRSSTAIGHADSMAPGRDQRGFKRDSHPDIGAFEFGATH